MYERIKKAKRIVIKIGTSILTTKNGNFSKAHLNRLCSDVTQLIKNGKEVVLVSSGAIGLGMEIAGFKKRPKKTSQLQACAAAGQGKLMHAYESAFSKRGLHTGQVLLTREGLADRKRFLNASHTLKELLRCGLIPIINENDTISTEELTFGDNDRLSVHVSHLVHADLLILLSDIDGFFLNDGTRVRQVNDPKAITGELSQHVRDSFKEKNVGGMKAKLTSALTAMQLGIPLLMMNGHRKELMIQALNGEDIGTFFCRDTKKRSAREMWVSFSAPRKGVLVIDDGAVKALSAGKVSLLASGVVRSRGEFDKGQVVEIEDLNGRVLGRGVMRFGHKDLKKIYGKKSAEINKILAGRNQNEVIHRNDLVIWD